ncbi:hypothetical protein ABZP36_025025 [Zizania latifolia]
MAWSRFGESGLELSLGLPAYFSKTSGQAGLKEEGSSGADAFALQHKGSNASKARSAAAPVVGWPPVRSFRRNLASSSSKPAASSSSQSGRESKDDGAAEHLQKGLFVKINMDGVPIGRKVDLTAYGGYSELSSAVDKLFRGLLAAQRDPAAADGEVDAAAGGMVDGGEYTLVYEDDEGDRMLVGDVPWQMFIATAKRLRVLKSSDLPPPSLIRAAGSRKRAAADS